MAKKEVVKPGRMNVLRLGVINIVTHPHSPENYLELFRETFALKRPAKIRGNDWGIIGSLYKANYYEGKFSSNGPAKGDILHGTILQIS